MKRVILLAASVLALAACGDYRPSTAQIEQQQQEATQSTLIQATPIPQLQYSAERQNLVKRAERLNTENVNGCVTLLSYGRVIAQYNVAGKVSSLNAYLTGDQRAARLRVQGSSMSTEGGNAASNYLDALVESPDVDGAYGENPNGIFFFEANTDAYVEWHGDYLFSDQCLTPNERPAMSRIVP